jgi:LPXTG-motif cell wall-anchored protein
MRPRLLSLIVALASLAALGPLASAAQSHGGDEQAVEDLKMQPARILAQQALAELQVTNDTEEAAVRLDAALESDDTSDVDMPLLRKATETLDGGDPHGAVPLLDQALSRPLGAASGEALHEAGREFQPATGTQEIVGMVAGAALVLLGAGLLARDRLQARL